MKFSSAEFHFVNIFKNYTRAQRYCREKFTDLATVANSSDDLRLLAVLPNITNRAWIGLQVADAATWYWAMPEHKLIYLNWEEGEPKGTSLESCGAMNSNGRWFKSGCNTKRGFVCGGESHDDIRYAQYMAVYHHLQLNSLLIILLAGNDTHGLMFFADKKSWRRAQDQCRALSSELVSIQGAEENSAVHSGHTHESVWIGLFKDPWRWSDGSNSSYRFWRPSQPNNKDQNCVAVIRKQSGMWNNLDCGTKFRFICRGREYTCMKCHSNYIAD